MGGRTSASACRPLSCCAAGAHGAVRQPQPSRIAIRSDPIRSDPPNSPPTAHISCSRSLAHVCMLASANPFSSPSCTSIPLHAHLSLGASALRPLAVRSFTLPSSAASQPLSGPLSTARCTRRYRSSCARPVQRADDQAPRRVDDRRLQRKDSRCACGRTRPRCGVCSNRRSVRRKISARTA